LNLSEEHSGFIFESDPVKSIAKIKKHSNGTGSMVLQMMTAQKNVNERDGDMNNIITKIVISSILVCICFMIYCKRTSKGSKREEKAKTWKTYGPCGSIQRIICNSLQSHLAL
jgi:hypothetical protein